MKKGTSSATRVAEALLKIGAVGFALNEPITFKSGIKSPVYVDNRRFPFHPQEWKIVIAGFADVITQAGLIYEVIAGIETAGIPHSAGLGLTLEQPTVFVRKAAKEHGTKKRVEGGSVVGRRVLLLEDHITTGGSSLSGVEALRAEGAEVTDCIAITSYAMKEADQAFAEAGVKLHVLCDFETIMTVAITQNILTAAQGEVINDWLSDPHGWAARQGK